MLSDFNTRPVLFPLGIIADSRGPRFIVLLWRLIALILLVGHNSQVAQPVVQGIEVDMIYFKSLWAIHEIIMELLSTVINDIP